MKEKQNFHTPFVVVFIPAYNEEEAIAEVVKRVKGELESGEHSDFYAQIVVINDGSKDDTYNAARATGVKVVNHPVNMGLGAATRTGMQTAFEMGADLAVKVDGDLQNNPKDMISAIRPILEDKTDVVFGSRFLGRITYKMPTHRSLGNKFFSWLTGFLVGRRITDSSTGLIAFNRRYLSRFSLIMNYNETQQLIIDSWGKGMRVIEIPITTPERKTGKSFISWKYPFRVIPAMLRTYIHVKPLKSFFYVGLVVFLLGVLVGVLWFFNPERFFGDATAMILVLTGIQIILFGFLADIIVKRH